jgi:hypothetical protein
LRECSCATNVSHRRWGLGRRRLGGARGAKTFVLILYKNAVFSDFGNFIGFVESISCERSESCQGAGTLLFSSIFGSNPCWGKKQALPEEFSKLRLEGKNRYLT